MPERGQLVPEKPITGKIHASLFSEFFTSYFPFSIHSYLPFSLHICFPVTFILLGRNMQFDETQLYQIFQ